MKQSSSNSLGFTLLEVLLGLTITALVMVILLAALRMGHRSQDKGLERAELAQRMRMASDRLSWLLGGAYPYRYTDPDDEREKLLLFRGSAGSVEFVTTATDEYSKGPADIVGLKFVRIFVDSDGLKAAERVFFMGVDDDGGYNEEEFVFAPRVDSIVFEYMDIDEDTGEAQWIDEWDTEQMDYLPAAVRASLTINHAGTTVEIPPVVAAIMTGGSRGLQIPEGLSTTVSPRLIN